MSRQYRLTVLHVLGRDVYTRDVVKGRLGARTPLGRLMSRLASAGRA